MQKFVFSLYYLNNSSQNELWIASRPFIFDGIEVCCLVLLFALLLEAIIY